MTSYYTTNIIAMHVGQFMRLRDYCITTGLFKFGYGELKPNWTMNNDPNSDYSIFQSVMGRLKTQYGHHVYVNGDFICYDNRRIAETNSIRAWVDM